MFGIGGGEAILLLVLALVFVGPKKIPELAKGLGKGIREFQKAKNEMMDSFQEEREIEAQHNPEVASNNKNNYRETVIETTGIRKEDSAHSPHVL